MKTRKKTVKTPTKGRRRSSVIVVKKSPIRRNYHRNLKIPNKYSILTDYESPLRSLRDNGPVKPSTSSNLVNKDVKNVDNISSSKYNKVEQVEVHDSNEEQDVSTVDIKDKNTVLTSNNSECKERNITMLNTSNSKLKLKKQKLKKSPLSKFNESSKMDEFSESIILIDDSMTESVPNLECENSKSLDTKSTINNEIGNKNMNTDLESLKPTQILKPEFYSDEVVEIDCNDTVIEMEAYHDAFNQSTDQMEINPVLADSVIVIDPDDDNEDKTINAIPKPTEDCFVVWSSLPKPSTSSSTATSSIVTNTHTFSANPLYNNNVDILKSDKILIDTNAEFSNLRLINNENNKPKKNQKTLRAGVKGAKKSPLKVTVKGKSTIKNLTKDSLKSVDKPADSFFSRAAAKASIKVATKAVPKTTTKSAVKTTTTSKKKGKTNGQLIFTSESKEQSEKKSTKSKTTKGKLREIVIDGCNAAMAYTHNKKFSEKGIQMLIDYFIKRGHLVKVFVPQSRRSRNFPLLEKWHNDGIVIFTPSRKIGNKFITSYDDRYILEYATACGGIVVSQDQFRDLYAEKPQYRDTIENRLLVPTFVGDYVMFPQDPLGRNGPTLTDFLKH